jgi:hypothetical protein
MTFRLCIHNPFLCPNILDVVVQSFVSGPIYLELDGMGTGTGRYGHRNWTVWALELDGMGTGIRSSAKRASVDPCLRPRGHFGRPKVQFSLSKFLCVVS